MLARALFVQLITNMNKVNTRKTLNIKKLLLINKSTDFKKFSYW